MIRALKPVSTGSIGSNNERTNVLLVALMDFTGNPWGLMTRRALYALRFQVDRPG